MKEEPLEGDLYYGIEDRSYLDRDPVQPELLPEKLNQLRWKLNREKTQIINLKDEGATLDFLGYSFRYEDDLKGRGWKYLNQMPSKKALEKERQAIRKLTGPEHCFKPVKDMIETINEQTRGWKNYFSVGYPRRAFRDLNHFIRNRVIGHLQRRS
jgi:RNA-directed DNA polymerase